MKVQILQRTKPFELVGWQLIGPFLVACALLVTRRPDAVFKAQFWAEDYTIFFANSYNLGWWPCLFHTYAGYFHAVPRLGSALALMVPLTFAPLVFSLIAIACNALPVPLLLSSRSSCWGALGQRALLAAIYVAIPNCFENISIISNAHWSMALSAYLVIVAAAPVGKLGRIFECVLLLLSGLSDPFCLFLLPIALFFAGRSRQRWRWARALLVLGCSLIQLRGVLNADSSSRPHIHLGIDPVVLLRMLGGNMYMGTLIGGNHLGALDSGPLLAFLIFIAIACTALMVFCWVHSNWEFRFFLTFVGMVLAASLLKPAMTPTPGLTAWQGLASAGDCRYWFFPGLAFAWSLAWCFHSRFPNLKEGAGYLLLFMCIGIARDWRCPAFVDLHYAENIRRFEALPDGATMPIPINPPFMGLGVGLVKHAPGK